MGLEKKEGGGGEKAEMEMVAYIPPMLNSPIRPQYEFLRIPGRKKMGTATTSTSASSSMLMAAWLSYVATKTSTYSVP